MCVYRQPPGQVVLYNPVTEAVQVRSVASRTPGALYLQLPASTDLAIASRNRTGSFEIQQYARYICPTCLQSVSAHTANAWAPQLGTQRDSNSSSGTIVDSEYFNILARSLQSPQEPLALSNDSEEYHTRQSTGYGQPQQSGDGLAPVLTPSDTKTYVNTSMSDEGNTTEGVAESSFNQGYYERFFSEQTKLGKGLRGSVFSCQHILDNVYLGHYAVKKVAVGNNHDWLKRMLREVKLLESLRHPNVVEYKHSWLEMHQLTSFGPKIPCLFILMEYANGGNLQEYMEPKTDKTWSSGPSQSLKERILRMRRQSSGLGDASVASNGNSLDAQADGRRILSIEQIWSFFSDICNGLAHLHQLQIIHRDLKHMNLLLHWNDPEAKDSSGEIPRIMLTDFGECEILQHLEKRDRTGATGTMEFMAPELIMVDDSGRYLDSYSTKSDMWSLGMMLYYLCYSRLPFANIDDIDILRKDVLRFRRVDIDKAQRPAGAETIPLELRRIMQLLLNHDETKRPDVRDIIQLVSEHKDLWYSRRHNESRFELHDSDAASTYSDTSGVVHLPPRNRATKGKYTDHHLVEPLPTEKRSHLSKETAVGGMLTDTYQSSQKAQIDQLALIHLPPSALIQTDPITAPDDHSRLGSAMSNMYRRHSTGQHSIQTSGATTPIADDLSYTEESSASFESADTSEMQPGRDAVGLAMSSRVSDIRSVGEDDYIDSIATEGLDGAIPMSSKGAKRYLDDADYYDNSNSLSAKRQRDSSYLQDRPAFYLKTAILVAKVYALQGLSITNTSQKACLPYVMCVTLVMSAFDIQHQSLSLTPVLLVANACIVWLWLCFVD
ncbi:putative serine/threonine-protein kinase iks1 [Coemansia sp. RSA 988]|nr:putative serine/threonine-protein kinase iks1 [Coemansia sp. RSA 988]